MKMRRWSLSLLVLCWLTPLAASEKAHWSFRPLQRPSLPRFSDRTSLANPVDAFLGARLAKARVVEELLG
jgi:hypothetical protein